MICKLLSAIQCALQIKIVFIVCPVCSEERRGEASGLVGDEAVAKQHLEESDLSPNSVDLLVSCDYRWGSKTM